MTAVRETSVKTDAEPILIQFSAGKIRHPVRYVTIYYKVPHKPHDSKRKSEVAWIASGLPKGRKVYITAKAMSSFGYMKHECYGPIEESDHPIYSGRLQRAPKPGGVVWSYSITLVDADGKPTDSYDPDIHIDKDP